VTKEPDKDQYKKGTEVVIKAIPDKDYAFEKWEGSGFTGVTKKEIKVTVDGDYNLNAVFEKPKIEGRIVNKGDSPSKEIKVALYKNSIDNKITEVKTDSTGHYVFDPFYYNVGDDLIIVVNLLDNFSRTEIKNSNLLRGIGINSIDAKENMDLPPIDIYSYNFKLLKPEREETVTLPYKIKINHYERYDIKERDYYTYYYDGSDYIGHGEENFLGEEYVFDGKLSNDKMLSDDAYWYVGCNFKKNNYKYFINHLGHYVYLNTTTNTLNNNQNLIDNKIVLPFEKSKKF